MTDEEPAESRRLGKVRDWLTPRFSGW
jgi:hypothetical protein